MYPHTCVVAAMVSVFCVMRPRRSRYDGFGVDRTAAVARDIGREQAVRIVGVRVRHVAERGAGEAPILGIACQGKSPRLCEQAVGVVAEGQRLTVDCPRDQTQARVEAEGERSGHRPGPGDARFQEAIVGVAERLAGWRGDRREVARRRAVGARDGALRNGGRLQAPRRIIGPRNRQPIGSRGQRRAIIEVVRVLRGPRDPVPRLGGLYEANWSIGSKEKACTAWLGSVSLVTLLSPS